MGRSDINQASYGHLAGQAGKSAWVRARDHIVLYLLSLARNAIQMYEIEHEYHLI